MKDYLGNNRVLADGSGNALKVHHYGPFGEQIAIQAGGSLTPFPAGSTESPYKYGGKEWNATTSTYDFEARQMAPAFHRFTSMDPLCEKYYSISPYAYCANNPVNLVDPKGLSTHTDSTGRVLAVYNDKDLRVYKHNICEKDYNGEPLSATAEGVLVMGETEYWDEFVDPESGERMKDITIVFGFSFDRVVDRKSVHVLTDNLVSIALASAPGGEFDIKSDYPNMGGLLNGKYVTSRSAGNYLAGLNAAKGSLAGHFISFDTFQKLSGALHLYGKKGLIARAPSILTKGTAYGPAPTYGEIDYQYRQSLSGWRKGIMYRYINDK